MMEIQRRRLGANEPCWCGSGVKYKKCHRDEDQRAIADEIKEKVSSPSHSHLDAICDYFYPQNNTAAITQQAFHQKLGLMRREGKTILHLGYQNHLGRDEKLFEAAMSRIRNMDIVPHFSSDPPPEEVALGQRLLDRVFGQGAIELHPSGDQFRLLGKTRIQSTPSHLVAYWGAEGGIGTVLLEAMTDEKSREGFNVRHELIVSISVASVLELLEEISEELAHWRFPYESDGCHVHALETPHLFSSVLGDPQILEAAESDRRAVGVGLWLCAELDQTIDQVVERHRLPEGSARVLGSYWTRLQERHDLVDRVRAAGSDWRSPERARLWVDRIHAVHDADDEQTADPEPVPGLIDRRPPVVEEPGVRSSGGFSDLDSVRQHFLERREQIGRELGAIAERRSAIEECRRDLEARLGELSRLDAELTENAAEVERGQVDLDHEESRELAEAMYRISERAANELSVAEDSWHNLQEALDARLADPHVDRHSTLLAEIRQMRDAGTLSALPIRVRHTIEESERQALDALQALPETPRVKAPIDVPIAFMTTIESGHMRLAVVFPRAHSHIAGSLQAEIDEAIIAAARSALHESSCNTGTIHLEEYRDLNPGVLVLSAEGGEANEEIVQLALQYSVDAESRLTELGIRFDVGPVPVGVIEDLIDREAAVGHH